MSFVTSQEYLLWVYKLAFTINKIPNHFLKLRPTRILKKKKDNFHVVHWPLQLALLYSQPVIHRISMLALHMCSGCTPPLATALPTRLCNDTSAHNMTIQQTLHYTTHIHSGEVGKKNIMTQQTGRPFLSVLL